MPKKPLEIRIPAWYNPFIPREDFIVMRSVMFAAYYFTYYFFAESNSVSCCK